MPKKPSKIKLGPFNFVMSTQRNGLIVSGAGSTQANGNYVPTGTTGSQTDYVLVGNSALTIQYQGGIWFIVQDIGGNTFVNLYQNTSQFVDSGGWTTVGFGTNPAPTVRFG